MKTKGWNRFCFLLVGLLLLCVLSGCVSGNRDGKTITSIDQLTTERVGVQIGTGYEESLLARFPNVEVNFYNYATDMVVALKQGKLDGFVLEDVTYRLAQIEFPWLLCLEGAVAESFVGVAISNQSRYPLLQSQLEEFVEEMAASGQSAEMKEYWITDFDEEICEVDRSGITGESGVLAVAVENAFEPISYFRNGVLEGYDIDFIYRFCRAYGYTPEFHAVDYDAIPVGISTGKFDAGMSIVITEERSENITIVGPYLALDLLVAVKGEDEAAGNFFATLQANFENTFLKENRWLLFLEGAGTTLLITVLSALFGTLFGFVMYMLCKRFRMVNKVNHFINWFISGLPTILLLMVLYYVIFVDWASIDGIWVAIIGFTILFGYTMLDILFTSVSAIGKGQEEGARALGYNSTQTFFHIILPQALRVAFPQIKNELVNLIKETSIVGYIAISDLTRMSDIVRGRTYEAFFPLITSTAIYFVLIWLVIFVVKRIEMEMISRPIRIRKIQKGIHIK